MNEPLDNPPTPRSYPKPSCSDEVEDTDDTQIPSEVHQTTPTPHSYPKPSCSDKLEDTDNIHILGDVHQEPFKIDQGVNESPRIKDAFSDE